MERASIKMNHAAGMQEVYMYAVVRTYSGAGAKELFNLLEQRKADVEAVMRAVPGLVELIRWSGARRGVWR